MKMACDLEVDVNGEETFFVHKEILASFCGRLSKLLCKPSAMETTKTLKVVLHELPGGAEAFELITRFCYGSGKIELTPANTCILHCAAHFMEMTEGGLSSPSLTKLTGKALEGISDWMWPEVMASLRQCQCFPPMASSYGVLDKLLDAVVGRIATPIETSPTSSSPESAGFRFSFDTRSTLSLKLGPKTWWFEDLAGFKLQIIEKAVEMMISRKLDHVSICRFLCYYLKASLANATATEEKRIAIETVVDLLYSLDGSSVPCRSLFGILRASTPLNVSKLCRSRLESMIGARIDQVTLDNLLVAAPSGAKSCLYDVDLVLRFMKFFLDSGGRKERDRLKKAGSLMDMYLAEVAPDSGLKPAKFVELATALPDAARDSHDDVYRSIDMYLEIHSRLSEDEKMQICCAINYEKLSSECCKHLAQNTKFPSRAAIEVLVFQHSKLKNLLEDTGNARPVRSSGKFSDDNEQIILYAKKLDLSTENAKLRENLQGMQWKVMELEKVCRKMQIRMGKMRSKSRKVSHRSSSRSLPKLCS